ncbi:hypothetical protein [Streptomyces natalensis]|uniref:hypothetical protein n=1 Tax=Streptomyces natalensis TaxID=68242 RepID=UPI0018E3F0B1|nr:hypothetical protein [Streptomyces natalensis]
MTGLPLTSGPIVVVMLAEHGNGFAARTSAGMLLGLVSGCGFCLAYAATARRWGWAVSLMTGLATFAACTLLLWVVRLPAIAGGPLVLLCLSAMLHWWPKGTSQHTAVGAWWDVPLRMACAGIVVLAITAASDVLGPRLSGLLAPLQVIAAIMAVFTHRAEGGVAAAYFLRGVVQGSFAFAGFFLVLALALPEWGATPVLLLACSVALHIQVLVAKAGTGGRRPVGKAGAPERGDPQAAPASLPDDSLQEPCRELELAVANQGRVSKEAG